MGALVMAKAEYGVAVVPRSYQKELNMNLPPPLPMKA